MEFLVGDKPILFLSTIPAHFFRVKHAHTHTHTLPIFCADEQKLLCFHQLQPSESTLNKADFTCNLKRQDSSCHSSVF